MSRVDDVKLSEFSVRELEELSNRIAKALVIAKQKETLKVVEIEELALQNLKEKGDFFTR